VDGAPVERFGPDVPRPLVSVFLPERLELVRGGPSLRRSHLDQFAAALHPAVTGARSRYGRALAQRNSLLGRGRVPDGALLDAWDAELAGAGIELMDARREAARLLVEPFTRLAGELGLSGKGELAYRPRSAAGDATGLLDELRERRGADIQRGFTAHGPHRDELAFSHDGRMLRSYGSQGQQRIALLALLFAEREVLMTEIGRPPLMLLDDVMSELDAARRERLAELLRSGGQSFVTTTETEHVPGAGEPGVVTLLVEEGGVVEMAA
jgi:DNA replication and repair protein RecF